GPGVFAFSRLDRQQRVEYVVAVNNATTAQTVPIGTYSAGLTFDQICPSGGASLQTGGDKAMTVTVPALSTVVYRARAALPAPSAAPAIRLVSPASGAAVAGRAEVVAEAPGDPLATVSFAVRAGGGAWRSMGTADKAPYRVYHDLDGLAGGTTLEYKAVVRDSAGHTASATTTATVGTPQTGPDRDHLVVHYQRPAGDYAGWGLYAWGDIDPAWQTTWPAGQPFAGEDAYGRFAWVKLKRGARNVGFIVVDSGGVKDVSADRFADPSRTGE